MSRSLAPHSSTAGELTVEVRPVRPDDAPAIATLLGHLGYPNKGEEIAPRLGRIPEGDAVLVAEDDDGVVAGVAALHRMPVLHFDRPLGYITALVTDPAKRRGGVGKRLLEAAEEWARAAGCYRLVLTSAEHRTDAHGFYPACGFPFTGRRFGKDLA
jgi:GNAT superfamily N-acetyltransferase